ncbi:MAG: DUF4404 family protein [Mariniblastus sp.]|nr:DUF4404 family protein [Mariniblastus sp.]
MPNAEILKRFEGLHDDLSNINAPAGDGAAVDPKTAEALGQLVTRAHRLAQQKSDEAAAGISPAEHHEFLEQIQQFDAEHPTIGRILSQLTDLLGMMGI